MSTQHRILVVDDEPQYLWAIEVNLEARGYTVDTAADGAAALERIAEHMPDLILLDVRMPGMDGFEVCKRLRTFSMVPVIMLTALTESEDKVRGLDLGADDYVTKPINVPELLSRVRAALRRAERGPAPAAEALIQAGPIEIDLERERVVVDGQDIHLTPTEYGLLCELARQAGRVLSHDYLLARVWGMGYEGQTHLVRQAVHRIRQKVEPDPAAPRHIQTVVGRGYVFAPPEEG